MWVRVDELCRRLVCVDCEVSVLIVSVCVGVTCYQQSKTAYDFTQTIRFRVVIICVAHNAGATDNLFARLFGKNCTRFVRWQCKHVCRKIRRVCTKVKNVIFWHYKALNCVRRTATKKSCYERAGDEKKAVTFVLIFFRKIYISTAFMCAALKLLL